MRPSPACRTFNSTAMEKFITDMKARLKDPDIVRLFENTFPNTLDTTNLAFIITGDITAQCLRDIANQFAHYTALLSVDPSLATLVKAVINNEAHYVFPAPPESGLAPSDNDWADGVTVNPSWGDNTRLHGCICFQQYRNMLLNQGNLVGFKIRSFNINWVLRVVSFNGARNGGNNFCNAQIDHRTATTPGSGRGLETGVKRA
ncbi:Six-hairpin glycosidase-like protein [Mycena leptocephala]|nr:Six-hairpin glycosidase-like protein [Mycena leptocephala]